MAYSEDLKQRVLEHARSGVSATETAKLFCVARCTVYAWLAQPADHKRKKPGPTTSRKIDRQKLCELVAQQPDLMIKEIVQILDSKRSMVHKNLQKLGLRRKKNTAIRASL